MADGRSDLYGLGCVLLECLAGGPIADTNPRDAVHRLNEVPADLRRAIERCLARSPLGRFENAAAFRMAIERATGEPVRTAGTDPRAKTGWGVRALAGVALLAAVASLLMLVLRFAEDPVDTGPDVLARRGADALPIHEGSGRHNRYENSYALLIGIGEAYADAGLPPLYNAESDVAAIADRLREMTWEEWQVKALVGRNADQKSILVSLAELEQRAGPDDRVFIYYAGHGERHENSNKSGWLLPADALPREADPGFTTWIDFHRVTQFFDHSKAKHVLVAMDCCYSGRLVTSRSAGTAVYQERYLRERAHLVLTSGRRNEVVSDGVPGQRSPFARAFLEVLRRSDTAAVVSTTLYDHVRRTFLEDRVGHSPELWRPEDELGGEFVFFLRDSRL